MTANISFIIAQRENALTIPNGALRFRPPENAMVETNSAATQPATKRRQFCRHVRRQGHRSGHARGEHPVFHAVYVLRAKPRRQSCSAADQDRHQRRHFDRGAFGTERGRAGCDRRGFSRHTGRQRPSNPLAAASPECVDPICRADQSRHQARRTSTRCITPAKWMSTRLRRGFAGSFSGRIRALMARAAPANPP